MSRVASLSLLVSSISLLVGAVAFFYNWNIYGGGWDHFGVFLFPGNLVLSMFTEEIDFWSKLALQMSGQFFVTFAVTFCFVRCVELLSDVRNRKRT